MTSNGDGQSGGLEVSGRGALHTGGGDAFGGDKLSGNYIAASRDRSPEMAMELLNNEIKEKNKELETLRGENKLLTQRIGEIDALFSFVKNTVGDYFVSVTDYIMFTNVFFIKTTQYKNEFVDGLPENVRTKAEKR
jgi:ABC-type microcin C transport system permease subunit YejB